MTPPEPARPSPYKRHSPRAIFIYTQCRRWHGYLSAFAFLALIFFSGTGILLNHPDWLPDSQPPERTVSATLAPADMAVAHAGPDAGPALARAAAAGMPLLGAYASADIEGQQAILRFEGVKGTSDVTIDMKTGHADARLQPADTLSMLDDLHRGKNAGAVWQWVIDITAALILVLSIIGYVLFFSMRFRLRTSLLLTAASIGTMAGVFLLFVP